MELYALNYQGQSQEIITGWESLIWTERYAKGGDFELTSYDIKGTLEMLRIDPRYRPHILRVNGPSQYMVVEKHVIKRSKNEPPKIITSGRSLDSVLDRRVTVYTAISGQPRPNWTIEATLPDVIFNVMHRCMVVGGPHPWDKINDISIVKGSGFPAGLTAQKYIVEPKNLYDWVLEMLEIGKYGIRGYVVEKSTATNKFVIEIYNGQDISNKVVFDLDSDQFEDSEYVLSDLGYKNVVLTATAFGQEYAETSAIPPADWNRRVEFQDLSNEIKIAAGADLTKYTKNRGIMTLKNMPPTALFSGGVSPRVGDEYGDKWRLGDIVTLKGSYGLTQKARVAEFIRTHDASGYKAYPTFESINANNAGT